MDLGRPTLFLAATLASCALCFACAGSDATQDEATSSTSSALDLTKTCETHIEERYYPDFDRPTQAPDRAQHGDAGVYPYTVLESYPGTFKASGPVGHFGPWNTDTTEQLALAVCRQPAEDLWAATRKQSAVAFKCADPTCKRDPIRPPVWP